MYHIAVADATKLGSGWIGRGTLAGMVKKLVDAQGLDSYFDYESDDDSTTFGTITTIYFRECEDMEAMRLSLKEAGMQILSSGFNAVND